MADLNTRSLVLFDSDLRTIDNPALDAALLQKGPVVGLYILDNTAKRPMGSASLWWLHHSLQSLEDKLKKLNIQLLLKRGKKLEVAKKVAKELSATHVFWNRFYDESGVAFGSELRSWCNEEALASESFNGCLLHEPYRMKTKAGGPFKVFTPFWKTFLADESPWPPSDEPEPAPKMTTPDIQSDALEDWALEPQQPNWAKAFPHHWRPGQDGAMEALQTFLGQSLEDYSAGRDFPAQKATSRLSPHLRFGEISPRQIWHATRNQLDERNAQNANKFLSEVGWREFAHHLLFHCEDLKSTNVNSKFDHFSWSKGDDTSALLKAWQKGQTGYPLVDAGMRELWQTGWMHNRVRMVVGSFLVKHLLIDWREGEEWFWDTLVDACPANNAASWQWIAGCGADAAPYFRIFNPITQSEKFDPDGAYIRQFVPELAKLPSSLIHKPWSAKKEELALCKVTLGENYPHPIVDHAFARERALKAFNTMKQQAA